LVSYTRYLEKCFWPTNMGLYYPHPGTSLHFWQWGGSLLVLAAITVLATRDRKHRYLIVGWLWFLIMLVPMIGIVQVDVQGMADRYAYDSFIGIFIMVCWGVADFACQRHLPKAALPAATGVALVAMSVVTWQQIGYWQDDLTLWEHSAAVMTGNWKAEFNVGMSLSAAGQQEAAAEHWLRAAQYNPTDPFINQQLGIYEHQHRHYQQAIEYYKKVLPQAWNTQQRTEILSNMATAYRQMGDYADANQCMAKLNATPKQNVDWQGAWWKQIIPMLKEYLHMGGAHS
jgi:protein O-mannosyl-transferase